MNTAEQAVKRPMVNVTMVEEAWDADVVWTIVTQNVKRASVVRMKGNASTFSCGWHRTDVDSICGMNQSSCGCGCQLAYGDCWSSNIMIPQVPCPQGNRAVDDILDEEILAETPDIKYDFDF